MTPLWTFFALWLPVLFALVAEPLTGLVDTGVVARLGADALAALGVGTMVLSSVFRIFNVLGVGSQTEVSQALGRGDMDRGRRIASLALAGGAGLLLMLVGWFCAAPVAAAMGANGQVRSQAVVSIRWRVGGAPAVLLTLTVDGVSGLGIMGANRPEPLTVIWWGTGLRIAVRASLGMLRIWPGIGKTPLAR